MNLVALIGTLDWVREVYVDEGKAFKVQFKVSRLNRFNKVERFGGILFGKKARQLLEVEQGSMLSIQGALSSNKDEGVYILAKEVSCIAPPGIEFMEITDASRS